MDLRHTLSGPLGFPHDQIRPLKRFKLDHFLNHLQGVEVGCYFKCEILK